MIKAYAAHEAGGKLVPFEYDPGPLGGNEVELDVEYCGICHSDLSMLNDEWGMSQFPLVPGHEAVGTVKAAGENVAHLEVGDRVGLGWHAGFCGTCEPCQTGDQNMCASGESSAGLSDIAGSDCSARLRAVSAARCA